MKYVILSVLILTGCSTQPKPPVKNDTVNKCRADAKCQEYVRSILKKLEGVK